MKKKTLACVFAAVLCFGFNSFASLKTPAQAVSMPFAYSFTLSSLDDWDELSAIKNFDNLMEIEDEVVTFDLPSSSMMENGDTDTKVTSEFSLTNTSKFGLNYTLMTPYAYSPAEDENGEYGVFLNGEKIETKERYAYYSQNARPYFGDAKQEGDFYKSDTNVTAITYKIEGKEDSLSKLSLSIEWTVDTKEVRICGSDFSVEKTKTGYKYYTEKITQREITVYLIGYSQSIQTQSKFTTTDKKVNPNSYFVNGDKKATYTLDELINSYYNKFTTENEDINVSEIDFYNSMITYLESDYAKGNNATAIFYPYAENHDMLIPCYTYIVSLAVGEKSTVAVVSSIKPTERTDYSPSVFVCDYWSTVAKKWGKFGSLKIVINTDCYMTNNSGLIFEKTENGYSVTLDKLPTKDVQFSLCSTEDPTYVKPNEEETEKKGCKSALDCGLGSITLLLSVALLKKRNGKSK